MSDMIVLTPEITQDVEKTLNFFNISDVRRKNKFLIQYLQEHFKNKITNDKVIQFFRQLQVNDQSFNCLMDNLYLVSLFAHGESRKQLITIIQLLSERLTQQQKSVFFDYFDEELLWECQFVQKELFQKNKQKVNTNLNFVQTKYGIMRDENEGYSKLVVEILEAADGLIDENTQIRVENIISLIGYFDLDPDRVVDLIVQSWIEQPNCVSYIEILRQFKCFSVSQFLGKRLEQILHTIQNTNLGVTLIPLSNAQQAILTDQRVPGQNLIQVIALALKHQLFTLDQIWKYLQPLDKDMSKAFEDLSEESFKYYKSFDQVLQIEELKDHSPQTQQEKMKNWLSSQFLYNQKLWLMQGLLQQNCYDIFIQVYQAYEDMIDLTNFLPLKKTLAQAIDFIIHPYFNPPTFFKSRTPTTPKFNHSQNHQGQLNQTMHLPTFLKQLSNLLAIFYPYLAEYPVLFHKVLKSISNIDFYLIKPIVINYLLPAIGGGDCLPAVMELWKLFEKLDYKERYACYSNWKDNQQFQSIAQVVRAADLTKQHIRVFFNKIDKENKDRMMLKFAKLTHSQPIAAMNQLRRNRLELADNNSVIVHGIGLVTPLTLDILLFTFIQWMSDFTDETKIKDKDIDCKQWFKNIAMFIATTLRKYYNLDMQGLFAYICEQLASTTIIKPDLIILRELIEKMTGIVHIEDLTSTQIQALAGGRYIQLETTAQTSEFRKSRKSYSALEQFFWTTTIKSMKILNQDDQEEVVSLAFLLLVMLCQQRSRFILNYHNSNLKPLSALYDNFTWSINQLTKCLLFQTDNPQHYALLFPKNALLRMVIHFKIPFEMAFHIVRFGHKSLYNMSDEEFKEERDNIKKIYDQIDPQRMFINPDLNDESVPQLPNVSHTLYKENIWSILSPDLFAIFWLLSLDNIYVPIQIYDSQIKSLQDNVTKDSRQSKNTQKAYEKLQNELENNKKRKEEFDRFLLDKKDCFTFKDVEKEFYMKFSYLLSQVCLLPRILIDPSEAIYCAKFVQTFLRIGSPKQTFTFYVPKDILYCTLTYLQCATEQEASNLSIFTQQLLLPFSNWNDEHKYRSDLKSYYGVNSDSYEKERNYIVSNYFVKIQQFIKCLRCNETQVRNALIFLRRMQDVFPPTQQIAEGIKQYFQDVEKEYGHLNDIKVQIRNYHIDEKIANLPFFQQKPLPDGKKAEVVVKQQEEVVDEKDVSAGEIKDTPQNSKHSKYNKDEESRDRHYKNKKANTLIENHLKTDPKRKHDEHQDRSRERDNKKKKSHDRDRGPKRLNK